MRHSALRSALTVVAVVAVAVLVLFLLRPKSGAAYERCRKSLHGRIANTALAGPLLRSFNALEEWKATSIVVNESFAPGRVNVLLPDSTEHAWDETACEIPASPATCIARRSDSTIVCNPALSRQVLSRRIQPGPWQPGAYLGARYLVLAILGHELAHLRDSTRPGARDGWRPIEGADATCVVRKDSIPSEEDRADDWGSHAASRIIQRDETLRLLPTDISGVLRVLQQLQNDLDREYFSSDDACRGTRDYPSLSRRKQSFTRNFIGSVYVDSTNPIAELMDEERRALDRTESLLRVRQVRGYVASGDYGRPSLYDHTVVSVFGARAFLTLDASGTSSTLWLARSGWLGVSLDSLMNWPNVGHVLHVARHSDGVDLLFKHGDTLSLLAWRCGVRFQKACARVESHPLPKDASVLAGADGSILVRSTGHAERFRGFPSFAAARADASWTENPAVDEIATDSMTTIAFTVADRGLYIGESQSGAATRPFALDLQGTTGCVQAPRIIARRLLFLIREGDENTGNCNAGFLPLLGQRPETRKLGLWDCPIEVTTTSAPAACHVYAAPPQVGAYVPSGSLDLEAMTTVGIDVLDGMPGGIAIQNYGSMWILDRINAAEDVVPGRGAVRFDASDSTLVSYRARLADVLRLHMAPSRRSVRSAKPMM